MLKILFTLTLVSLPAALSGKEKPIAPQVQSAPVVIWASPQDISTRNLFYGIGGEKNAPPPSVTFTAEDTGGTNPKFDVRDAAGVKWKAKLGLEAQPETVAARLLWAVGYFTDEDYLVPTLHVDNLPAHLKRGGSFQRPGGAFENVRLERKLTGAERVATWKWKHNPFSTTRELNGLRIMMALINNWDLKNENNAVYASTFHNRPYRIYVVSDLGASFGSNGLRSSRAESKGDPQSFAKSKFLTKVTPAYVNVATPGRPTFLRIFIPTEYFSRIGLESIGKHIPRRDAAWIGSLLAQLSPAQIRDAFRAANYSPQEIETYATVIEARIAELKKL